MNCMRLVIIVEHWTMVILRQLLRIIINGMSSMIVLVSSTKMKVVIKI